MVVNISLNPSNILWLLRAFFIKHHALIHPNKMKWLNKHLIETTRTLLIHTAIPSHFWGDVILTTYYLINRMLPSVLHNQVPHSILFSHDPLYPLPFKSLGPHVLFMILVLTWISCLLEHTNVSS